MLLLRKEMTGLFYFIGNKSRSLHGRQAVGKLTDSALETRNLSKTVIPIVIYSWAEPFLDSIVFHSCGTFSFCSTGCLCWRCSGHKARPGTRRRSCLRGYGVVIHIVVDLLFVRNGQLRNRSRPTRAERKGVASAVIVVV